MKKKELEMILQKVSGIENPSPSLEQYQTPAGITADILFNAYGDINGKEVIDLGCGTGIFCIGAALLGAKKVVGIDIDKSAVETAEKQANELVGEENDITFIVKDVENVSVKADVVIMNPPFGSQRSNRNADRIFLKKGLEIAPIVYSTHLKKTIPFIKTLISSLDGEITFSRDYSFPIKRMFAFHRKRMATYDVTLLRIAKQQK
ncbi:MAG: METTL5 family protein [Candidatus Thermoplasmatota archaeon]|nr:METTL5 family protein [Candidatus Thermoplasmatota archaeon]